MLLPAAVKPQSTAAAQTRAEVSANLAEASDSFAADLEWSTSHDVRSISAGHAAMFRVSHKRTPFMSASACTCGLLDTSKERRLPGAGGGRSELLRQMPRSVGGFISSSQPEDGARAHADTALTANGSAAGSAVGPRGGFNALKFKLPSRF